MVERENFKSIHQERGESSFCQFLQIAQIAQLHQTFVGKGETFHFPGAGNKYLVFFFLKNQKFLESDAITDLIHQMMNGLQACIALLLSLVL